MPVSVSSEEYLRALDRARAILLERPEPRPVGVKAVVAFLAWAYDTPPVQARYQDGLLDLLLSCDDETAHLLLTIIAGRLTFGRPKSDPPL